MAPVEEVRPARALGPPPPPPPPLLLLLLHLRSEEISCAPEADTSAPELSQRPDGSNSRGSSTTTAPGDVTAARRRAAGVDRRAQGDGGRTPAGREGGVRRAELEDGLVSVGSRDGLLICSKVIIIHLIAWHEIGQLRKTSICQHYVASANGIIHLELRCTTVIQIFRLSKHPQYKQ